MFRFHKTRDIVTLFHKASSPASVRVATLLKQVSAAASEHATEDQASDHTAQTHKAPQDRARDDFELNITEEPPTPDQLRTILDYVGNGGVSSIIKGASTPGEALKRFKDNADNFQRPVVVDWNNGKAVAGNNESAILKMINALPKEEQE